ncbi:putative ubiquitin-like-specific protease 1B [Platanthera zijinensis]|uniref:Ubiquitin-like-specific protease 1B n=1 Tax=Platanthera zijinensis TaxID=2320716 RepID=A0AAP0B2N4_9ASPA
MHMTTMRELLNYLKEDKADVLTWDIASWPIENIENAPTQKNSFDCGVFVMRYMETVLKRSEIDWVEHKG